MNPLELSTWERAQLLFLRVLSAGLGLIDNLLGVHWGERLLARLAGRWQAQVDQIDAAMATLRVEQERLEVQLDGLRLQTAVLYLGNRQLARGELRFDPAEPREEEILDATIELLVKRQLAAIEAKEVEPGRYIYHLAPDWQAIRARLRDAAEQAEPETARWLREGLGLLDQVDGNLLDNLINPGEENSWKDL
ncbi:MAG: hypothetical protein PVJ34_09855 [Anaerolineae bacterium]|jgi:hypothetical protein